MGSVRERGVGGGDMGNETKMGERIARKSWKGIGGGKKKACLERQAQKQTMKKN